MLIRNATYGGSYLSLHQKYYSVIELIE